MPLLSKILIVDRAYLRFQARRAKTVALFFDAHALQSLGMINPLEALAEAMT